ncbi:MAG: M28 family peptidase [Defluviitaleaceae bacterium]|nr:M28 family peptidase [Defluviitaleaceae bacterium]
MKKTIALILTLATILILAACSSQETEETQQEYEADELAYENIDYITVAAAPRAQIDTAQRTSTTAIGDIINFGGYSWVVLDIQDGHALIITEYAHILRGGGYWHSLWGPVSWAMSDIRRYLNDDFYNRFNEAEKAQIRETYVINNENPWNGTDLWYSSAGGENTMDKIFFLSVEEVVKYFGDSGQMDKRPESAGPLRFVNWISDEYDYARVGRNKEGAALSWWLRTPGAVQRLVAFVDPIGNIAMYGTSSPQTPFGARPALWLNLGYPAATARDWGDFAWAPEHFTETRRPLQLAEDTPHGHLAMYHILFMNDNLYSRKPFSYREKEAAVWLIEELLAMGHPWGNIAVQEFMIEREERWNTQILNPNFRTEFEFRNSTRLSQNVILTLPGQSDSQQFIVVGAHYDSWPTPGASDNASGVSLLLESAQRMLQLDNYYTIVYVFFGAEEVGLWGSNYFARNLSDSGQLDNLVMMVNADVLFEGPYLFYSAAYGDSELMPKQNDLTQQIDAIAQELNLGLIRYPYVLPRITTDHLPFFGRGHTVVNLMGLQRMAAGTWTSSLIETDGVRYLLRAWHSQYDCIHLIEANFPGKIQANMNAFSIFLEALLTVQQFY